jgi:hypothetical protein
MLFLVNKGLIDPKSLQMPSLRQALAAAVAVHSPDGLMALEHAPA